MTTWKKLHNSLPDWLLIVITVFVAVFFLSALLAGGLLFAYQDRMLPNLSVGGAYVGGMDFPAAREAVARKVSALEKGVSVRFNTNEYLLSPEVGSLDPDLAPSIVFDDEASFVHAAAIGHSGKYLSDAFVTLGAMLQGRQLPLAVLLDKERVAAELKTAFVQYEQPSVDAHLAINAQGEAKIIAEVDGEVFDYAKAAIAAEERFATGNTAPIELRLQPIRPTIMLSEIDQRTVQEQVDRLLETPSARLIFEKKEWLLDKKVLRSLLGLVKIDGTVRVGIDPVLAKAYIEKEVVPAVDREPIQARLAIENGRVSVWQEGKDGIAVDRDGTIAAIVAWPASGISEVSVAVSRTPAKSADESAEEMGIREIIGTGTSKFSGSPANRRHNIKTGAMALHGLLIKPGEEFSLLKALGNIDASNGYRTELVIKGNKTIPEYGGGLCQIGTTVFRATFNTGLPVTQRRNHSYRVSYYEPAGTDATIYDPAPDYRFVNDTGHYILIQARLGTNELSFDFWGTKDGRQVEVTKPTIYNIVAPKPTKIVETPDLPVGQKKCTESAHAGADAFFDSKVTYADGTVKEKRFTSHYVPWQAVCLVGAKKAETTVPPAGTPTSTVSPTATPVQ